MCEAKRIWQTGYAVHESHCVGHDCATGHRKCVFERFYLVREVIAFVAFTALLVFFLASPVVLGTMVPSSSRTFSPHTKEHDRVCFEGLRRVPPDLLSRHI